MQLKSSKKQLKLNACVPKSNSVDRYAIAVSLVCCVFDHLITTFAHARYATPYIFLFKQKILTKHL